jgi:formiminotetrahydrofolate cyclodeaminase
VGRRHEATGEDATSALVDRIASPDVTPASGTAVALVLELALALVNKTASRSAATWPGSGGALAQIDRVRERVQRCGEAVELSYAAAMEALAGEAGADGVLEERLRAAVDALLDLAAQAETTAELAAEISCCCDPAHRADATVAALLCDSAVRACAHLVELNLLSTPDDRSAGELRLMTDSVRASTSRALAE